MGQRSPIYQRILLKLSGEALLGHQDYGIDPVVIKRVATEVIELLDLGVQVGLVIGGGNIFRGAGLADGGMDRVTGDQMGMLATIINALALQDALEQQGALARVMSALQIHEVCEDYIRRRAIRHLERGRVVIFAAGTGNPFFTTDTAAALRAAEMNCDALMKGTQVDGVYDADPKNNSDAKHYDYLSYKEILARDLKVMDASAIALARENNIPIIVFSIHTQGAFMEVINGKGKFTIIGNSQED